MRQSTVQRVVFLVVFLVLSLVTGATQDGAEEKSSEEDEIARINGQLRYERPNVAPKGGGTVKIQNMRVRLPNGYYENPLPGVDTTDGTTKELETTTTTSGGKTTTTTEGEHGSEVNTSTEPDGTEKPDEKKKMGGDKKKGREQKEGKEEKSDDNVKYDLSDDYERNVDDYGGGMDGAADDADSQGPGGRGGGDNTSKLDDSDENPKDDNKKQTDDNDSSEMGDENSDVDKYPYGDLEFDETNDNGDDLDGRDDGDVNVVDEENYEDGIEEDEELFKAPSGSSGPKSTSKFDDDSKDGQTRRYKDSTTSRDSNIDMGDELFEDSKKDRDKSMRNKLKNRRENSFQGDDDDYAVVSIKNVRRKGRAYDDRSPNDYNVYNQARSNDHSRIKNEIVDNKKFKKKNIKEQVGKNGNKKGGENSKRSKDSRTKAKKGSDLTQGKEKQSRGPKDNTRGSTKKKKNKKRQKKGGRAGEKPKSQKSPMRAPNPKPKSKPKPKYYQPPQERFPSAECFSDDIILPNSCLTSRKCSPRDTYCPGEGICCPTSCGYECLRLATSTSKSDYYDDEYDDEYDDYDLSQQASTATMRASTRRANAHSGGSSFFMPGSNAAVMRHILRRQHWGRRGRRHLHLPRLSYNAILL